MRVLSVDLLSASVKYLCKRRSWVFCVFEWYSWGPCCDREVFREQGAGVEAVVEHACVWHH